jgi:hypothetical protein
MPATTALQRSNQKWQPIHITDQTHTAETTPSQSRPQSRQPQASSTSIY